MESLNLSEIRFGVRQRVRLHDKPVPPCCRAKGINTGDKRSHTLGRVRDKT